MTEKKNEFEQRITDVTHSTLQCISLDILQINLGLLCNQTCHHCHVNASPDRKEQMSWKTMETILSVTVKLPSLFIDITGGAPELHPHLDKFLRNPGRDAAAVRLIRLISVRKSAPFRQRQYELRYRTF